jgi:YidC/Oxa1 family membrane protein insertase
MQDQGKRLLLAVALALGVLFLWNTLTHKEEPPPDKAGSAETTSNKATPAGPAGASATAPAVKPAEELPRPPEETIQLRYDNFVATFSSYCGGLKEWELTDARYARDATKGRLLAEKSKLMVQGANGKDMPVPPEQLVNVPDDPPAASRIADFIKARLPAK